MKSRTATKPQGKHAKRWHGAGEMTKSMSSFRQEELEERPLRRRKKRDAEAGEAEAGGGAGPKSES